MNYKAMTNLESTELKKRPLMHPRVFYDEKWAVSYAKRHAKILLKRGFKEERILDVGCGSVAILMELSRAFPKVKAIGMDLSS